MEGASSSVVPRRAFTYSSGVYASADEVALASFLFVQLAVHKEDIEGLSSLVALIRDDAPGYDGTSPHDQGPWCVPMGWNQRGSSLDLAKKWLKDGASEKSGQLAPVQKIMAEDLDVELSMKGICSWRYSLLLGRDQARALLIPSKKQKLTRFPHMLPAIANYIHVNQKSMVARLDRAVTNLDLPALTERSPDKAALKAQNRSLQVRLSESEGLANSLEKDLEVIKRTQVKKKNKTTWKNGKWKK